MTTPLSGVFKPFSISSPSRSLWTQTPTRSTKATWAAGYEDSDETGADKKDDEPVPGIARGDHGPEILGRKARLLVYAVRVVAFLATTNDNRFLGPAVADRRATMLGMGGWVVPPLEERVKRRGERRGVEEDEAVNRTREHPVRPYELLAMPSSFDWTGEGAGCSNGEAAPVWRAMCEPRVEDDCWIAWQLLAGWVFFGFRPGAGFGIRRLGTSGNATVLRRCLFVSL